MLLHHTNFDPRSFTVQNPFCFSIARHSHGMSSQPGAVEGRRYDVLKRSMSANLNSAVEPHRSVRSRASQRGARGRASSTQRRTHLQLHLPTNTRSWPRHTHQRNRRTRTLMPPPYPPHTHTNTQ
eukprot:1850389-Rhodomonas_salina.9